MKLFLTSSTITPNLVSDFERLIGKSITGLKVAFIPDAADGVIDDDKSWVQTERQNLIAEYNWQIDDFVLKDIDNNRLAKLFNYDVVYVNGGFSAYLAQVMRKSGFTEILPRLFDAGIVYVGSSAGSMVMSDVQDASSWFLGEPEPEAIDIPGLGYIDFQIYPHVEDKHITEIKKHCKPELTYYLMKDGTAISIHNHKLEMCGDGIEVVGGH